MEHLLLDSLPFLAPAMLPAVVLLLAQSMGSRGRLVLAAVFGLVAVGFVGNLLVQDHTGLRTLEVPNVFPRGPDSTPHVWIVDSVKAPAWHWHIAVAVFAAAVSVWLIARRNAASTRPQPVAAGVSVFTFYLALRLALEKTAAPIEIVWAVGTTPVSVLILPFFAWYCGRHGYSLRRFVLSLLLMMAVQRFVLVMVSYVVTTRSLGTHLDVHTIRDFAPPGIGERTFSNAVEAWTWTVVIPNTALVVFGTVLGLGLGALPWWLARRRAQAPAKA